MLRGRQLLADALLLSLPQSLWLTSSSEGTFLDLYNTKLAGYN